MQNLQIIEVELTDLLQNIQNDPSPEIEVYTDGSCLGNPGPGGWAAIILYKNQRAILSGATAQATTNNRMELTAAIEALRHLPTIARITIFTDSNYLREGISTWVHGWKQNGWTSSTNKPVKNQDLWTALDTLVTERKVSWNWVKGHADCSNNNNADFIARSAISKLPG